MGVEELMNWKLDVDRYFNVMGILENKQVKMVAIRLKSIHVVWWDKLVVQRQRKGSVGSWQRMKQLMLEGFLLEDYEHILYKMYSPKNNFESVCDKKNSATTRDYNPENNETSSLNSVQQGYFKLSIKPHENLYTIGWVSKGSQVRVTLACRVPISIKKHFREDMLCDVIDMDVCHILLGRPSQSDKDITY
ncbi:hypothetical protein KIW84_061751 [Lathyrus oleraceus]|uniref:Uncharacterized protein n=1 Tax=Pisum sativum TaxID=3888 RepID=A0A9D5A4V7_PEA|nr:hypothetical protein KIW84_061751 [Pisum sativum]